MKTHKPGNKLRSIILQIPTPTYDISKRLDQIIKRYIPSNFIIQSTDEFINILRSTEPDGALVESLFSNVPVKDTIDIIINSLYNNPAKSPPKISKNILKKLLLLCTTKALFYGPDKKLYYQIDGVSMGSCLGPTFANFYMAHLENKVLSNIDIKPTTYCRYVDDIYVVVRNEDHLKKLQLAIQDNSVLKFTYELGVNNKLPFLDILVTSENRCYVTTVYTEPTNNGQCLNAESECSEQYKICVVLTFIQRAHKICFLYALFDTELRKIKQLLINNGYSNAMIDEEVKTMLNKIYNGNNNRER